MIGYQRRDGVCVFCGQPSEYLTCKACALKHIAAANRREHDTPAVPVLYRLDRNRWLDDGGTVVEDTDALRLET